MARNKKYTVRHRRRREGKTNYKQRLKYLDSGKVRFVIRKSSRYLVLQFIKYDIKGDQVLISVNSSALKKLGWNYSCKNIPASYLAGLLVGKRALEKGIKEGVLDIGLYRSIKGGVLYAALKGVIDAGVNIPCDKKVLPEDVSGKAIADYGEKLSKDEVNYKKQFSGYLKENISPSNIVKDFEVIKGKIK